MCADTEESWNQLVEPWDATARMVMAILRLLVSKGLVEAGELRDLADQQCQELATENEARGLWHTPWLPTEELAAMVGISSDMLMLDAGAGFGGPARQLAEQFGCRIIGVDRDPLRVLHAIRQTRKQGSSAKVSFCWADFSSLPFPDHLFDLVWAVESVTGHDEEWLEGIPTGMNPSVFNEFHRVLKPEGRLACQVWIRGPVNDADVERFLHTASFRLLDLEDCTKTWLDCMLDSIDHLSEDDPRKESWTQAYDEAVRRADRLYRFVAARQSGEPA